MSESAEERKEYPPTDEGLAEMARDIRREALENIRDVVLDKLIDLFNEMREELEEPK